MIPRIQILKYHRNLNEEILSLAIRGVEFNDIGFYYVKNGADLPRALVMKEVIHRLAEYSLSIGIQGLYIQVPVKHQPFYERHGFKIAGDSFQPEGWDQIYVPLYRLPAR